jgi:hypothetical protein
MIKILLLLAILLTGCVHRIAFAGEFYLAKIDFIDREQGLDYWAIRYADKNISRIDLRPNQNEGYAFAEYSELIDDPEFIYLGDSEDAIIPDIGNALGATFPPNTKVRGMLYLILTTLNNDMVCPPLMPDTKMDMKIIFRNKVIKSKKLRPEIDPEWPNIQKQLKKNYRQLRKQDKTLARKWLMVQKEKYKVTNTDQFIPDDLPKVTPLPHNTTLTESFDQVDSSTVGPDLTWVDIEITQEAETISNQFVSTSNWGNQNLIGHSDSLSSDDHYSKITMVSGTGASFASVLVRWNGSTSAEFYYGFLVDEGATTCSLYRGQAGFYDLATPTITAPEYPFELKLTVDGSALTAYVDDVEVASATDTNLTGQVLTGIGSYDDQTFAAPTITMDNFSSGDLADAPSVAFTIYNALISNANIA